MSRRRARRGHGSAAFAVWLALTASIPLAPLAPSAASAQASRAVLLDEIFISVNDKALTRREVEQFRALEAQELRRKFSGAELEAQLQQVSQDLTKVLVEDLLIESFAARVNVVVSDKEIDERVDNIVRRQPGVQEAYSDEQLKRFVVKDILRRRVLAREVDARVHVSQAEVQVACTRRAHDNRELDVGHILLRGTDDAARARLEALRTQLLSGAAFEDLAAKNSEDPSVTDNKGRLGFVSRGQFVKPFEDAAFALPVGGISEPVQTRFGLHVIKVFAERSKERVNCDKLDDVTRQSIENQVFAARREERLKTFLDRLRKEADIRVRE